MEESAHEVIVLKEIAKILKKYDLVTSSQNVKAGYSRVMFTLNGTKTVMVAGTLEVVYCKAPSRTTNVLMTLRVNNELGNMLYAISTDSDVWSPKFIKTILNIAALVKTNFLGANRDSMLQELTALECSY